MPVSATAKFGVAFVEGRRVGRLRRVWRFLAIQSLIDLGCALTEMRLEIRLTRMRNFSLGNDIDSTGNPNLWITVMYWLIDIIFFSRKRGRKLRVQVRAGKWRETVPEPRKGLTGGMVSSCPIFGSMVLQVRKNSRNVT
jgi:hypothetical protein